MCCVCLQDYAIAYFCYYLFDWQILAFEILPYRLLRVHKSDTSDIGPAVPMCTLKGYVLQLYSGSSVCHPVDILRCTAYRTCTIYPKGMSARYPEVLLELYQFMALACREQQTLSTTLSPLTEQFALPSISAAVYCIKNTSYALTPD